MAGGSSFDLTQTDQIPALETTSSMLELPQRRVGRAGMENIADCNLVSLLRKHEAWDRSYPCESHTCSAVAQMKRYSCV